MLRRQRQRVFREISTRAAQLLQVARGGRARRIAQLFRLARQRAGIGPGGIAGIEQLADPGEFVQQLGAPGRERHRPAVALQLQPGLAPAARRQQVVLVGLLLRGRVERLAAADQAQRQEGFHEMHLVRAHTGGLEDADVERAHLDVLDAAARQRPRRGLAGAQRVLRTDAAVVLVLDLQDAGVELAVLAVDAHAERGKRRMHGVGRVMQVAQVLIERIHRHRHDRLAAVAVAEVAHAQRGGMRQVQRAGPERLQFVVVAPGHEARAQRRRDPEQVQRQPAEAPVVAHQVEVARRGERGIVAARAQLLSPQRPEFRGKRVIEMRAGDGLHQAAVAGLQAAPVHFLEVPAVRTAVARDRHLGLAGDLARHRRGPQHFVAEPPHHKVVQVPEVARQRLVVGEGRRHQLEQRLGIIGGDVRVAQRAAQLQRVPAGGDASGRRDAQGLALEPARAARERAAALAAVDQPRQALLEHTVNPLHAPSLKVFSPTGRARGAANWHSTRPAPLPAAPVFRRPKC